MTLTISSITHPNDKLLRFTFTWEIEKLTQSVKGCLAGIDKNGKPWVMTPKSGPYSVVDWNADLIKLILSKLETKGLLKDLGTPWKTEEIPDISW